MGKKVSIGVDVGGSHICSAAYVPDEKRFLPQTLVESDLDNQGPADEILTVWTKTIAETIRKAEPCSLKGIGFAMPGPFDYYNGIALFKGLNKKYENLYGLNVACEVQKLLGLGKNIPVRFINDASAFAIGESEAGSAAGARRCLAITLGTGFGSAFLQDQIPVVSGDTVPPNGMVYHLPFEKATADDYFSTRGLLTRYFELTGIRLPGVRELAEITPGDPVAEEIFYDFGTKIGIFLKPWIQKFDVEVLVIGGNISKAFHLFGDNLVKVYAESGIHLKIKISELKETASIIGSAALTDDVYYNRIKPVLLNM
jgi:glucokinase